MKVLLAHKCFYYKGGAEVFFFEVARVLKEHGHEVAFFSCNDEQNVESEWSKYFIDAPDFKSPGLIGKLKAMAEIPYSKRAKKAFKKLLDDFQPDIVHCFNIMTHISPSIMVAARERNIPVVISHNDYKHICPNYKLYHDGKACDACKNGNYMNCLKNKCAHGSLAYSFASTLEAYVHKWLKIYEKNVTLHLVSCNFMANVTEEFWKRKINKGILLNPFKVPALSTEVKEGEYGLYFGRLVDEKGVDVLLKALTVADDIPFVIVGNGPEEDTLKKMATDAGLKNVKFVGPKWGKELDEYLNNCRYVVSPSTWQENVSYVLLQSFAACKPVIGSRRGGTPELVTSERGLLYEAEDYQALAEKMKELNADPVRCKRMGMAARKFVEETFNDVEFYKALETNYKRAFELNKK